MHEFFHVLMCTCYNAKIRTLSACADKLHNILMTNFPGKEPTGLYQSRWHKCYANKVYDLHASKWQSPFELLRRIHYIKTTV
jgi:hypothetical protein